MPVSLGYLLPDQFTKLVTKLEHSNCKSETKANKSYTYLRYSRSHTFNYLFTDWMYYLIKSILIRYHVYQVDNLEELEKEEEEREQKLLSVNLRHQEMKEKHEVEKVERG